MAARALRAATASDACDALGLSRRALAPDWRSLEPGTSLVGRAFVVQTRVSHAPSDPPYVGLLAALDQLAPKDVWVIGACGRIDVAVWGELLTLSAQHRGAAGALCDGAIRDVDAVRHLQFPVFARGRCPADINGRLEVTRIGGTIEFDGVAISSSDLIVADDDGVVVVPAEHADDVIEHTQRKHLAERHFAQDIANGMSATEAFARHQVL